MNFISFFNIFSSSTHSLKEKKNVIPVLEFCRPVQCPYCLLLSPAFANIENVGLKNAQTFLGKML